MELVKGKALAERETTENGCGTYEDSLRERCDVWKGGREAVCAWTVVMKSCGSREQRFNISVKQKIEKRFILLIL